jgi:hypothetical protein
VVGVADPEVQRAPGRLGLVAADVVAEEVVREQQVPRAPGDLLGLGQVDRRIGAVRLRAVRAEVRGVGQVRARPDPQVAGVLGPLIGQQNPGQQGERSRSAARAGRPEVGRPP